MGQTQVNTLGRCPRVTVGLVVHASVVYRAVFQDSQGYTQEPCLKTDKTRVPLSVGFCVPVWCPRRPGEGVGYPGAGDT